MDNLAADNWAADNRAADNQAVDNQAENWAGADNQMQKNRCIFIKSYIFF